MDSEELMENINDPLLRRKFLVMSLLPYMAADPRWDLSDGREASAWPPETAWAAYIEPLESIGFLTTEWGTSETEWQGILACARAMLADPEAQRLAMTIADGLMAKQTLLTDDLARIMSPALDRAMGNAPAAQGP